MAATNRSRVSLRVTKRLGQGTGRSRPRKNFPPTYTLIKYWQPTAGFMASVACGLTAEDLVQFLNPTLVSSMGLPLPSLITTQNPVAVCVCVRMYRKFQKFGEEGAALPKMTV